MQIKVNCAETFRKFFHFGFEFEMLVIFMLTIVIAPILILKFLLPFLIDDYKFLKHSVVPDEQKNEKQPLKKVLVIGASFGGELSEIIRFH